MDERKGTLRFLDTDLEHPNGMFTHYGEIDKARYHVEVGDKVKRGELIGYQDSRYDELHFQLQTQLQGAEPPIAVDPFKLITDQTQNHIGYLGMHLWLFQRMGAGSNCILWMTESILRLNPTFFLFLTFSTPYYFFTCQSYAKKKLILVLLRENSHQEIKTGILQNNRPGLNFTLNLFYLVFC